MQVLHTFKFLIILPFWIYAQNPVSIADLFNKSEIEIGSDVDLQFLISENYNEEFHGLQDFQQIEFISKQQKAFKVNGRLNGQTGQFNISYKNKNYLLNPHAIIAIKINQQYYLPYLAPAGEVENKVFFQLLVDGKLQLLKRFDKYDKIKPRNFYVYNQGLKKLFSVKMKKKEILKLFKGNAQEVENFANQQQLKFSEKEDLKKIFEFFNQMEVN